MLRIGQVLRIGQAGEGDIFAPVVEEQAPQVLCSVMEKQDCLWAWDVGNGAGCCSGEGGPSSSLLPWEQ